MIKSSVNSNNDKAPGQQAPNRSNLLRQVMYGRVVTSDFFARNWLVMLLIVSMVMVYIAGKYTCQTKMEQVRSLTSTIEKVRAERIRARSAYMSSVRETSMQQMIDTMHLGLSVRENPPFVIESEK